ncbi:MAG: UvrB/UvrC motif-containing protein [bacterium]|nr:UvrB/UvrC motif-containing protein [bacterium]
MLSRPTNISASAGVYLFKHHGAPIYIGKAKSLKKRLVSYWRKNANDKIKSLLSNADSLEVIETQSEIEALIKESELVKKHLPKYNVLLRDDKNYFYMAITKEKFPRIFITHQPFTPSVVARNRVTKQSLKRSPRFARDDTYTYFIGPFTSGSALRIVLKLVRKIFPYCTCKSFHKRPCLNSQIGRCSGFCCTEVVPSLASSIFEAKLGTKIAALRHHQKYQENIKNVISVLTGKKKSLLKNLKKEIKKLSEDQRFEEAGKIRDQILGIENIFAHRVILREISDRRISRDPSSAQSGLRMTRGIWPKIEKELQSVFGSSNKISRVEGYDISNISGKEATGSMVVFNNGLSDKKEYRQFKIKTVKQVSDVDMLKEVIKRRANHLEWPNPDLTLIDGGKPQLNAALSVIEYDKNLSNTLIAALAKREEGLFLPKMASAIKINNLSQPTSSFLKRVRDESHRFARRYHHQLRGKSVFS